MKPYTMKQMVEEKVRAEQARIALEMKCDGMAVPKEREYIPGGIELGVPERR